MGAVLFAVAVFLAVLLSVVIVLLAIPIDVRARLAAETALSWVVQVRWLFGLIRVERNSASGGSAAGPPVKRAARKRARRRRRGGRSPAFIKQPAVWRRAVGLLRSSLRGLKWRRVDAHLQVGLDDPADTGRLFGIVMPAMAFIAPMLPGRVVISPDFQHAGLAGRAEGELRIVPLRVLAPVASFGLWLGWRAWRTGRRR